MAYVITQSCCKDTSCVSVCPVDCISPVPAPGEATAADMLYIDPAACIDCGACVQQCPVGAIYHEDELPPQQLRFRDINARYFREHPLAGDQPAPRRDHPPVRPGALRVAIVGCGPAGCYAAGELTRIAGVEVDMFDRLPTPYGLLRAGVAPDHQHTKAAAELFDTALAHPRLRCHFNVEVGRDLTHQELLEHHHAVIYATGAATSADLGLAGEEMAGSHAAAEFVGWYNGHPDHAGAVFDLSGPRAVVIGNGNVALDMARILLTGPDELARTDIAQHALDDLAASRIGEVVILARRGPRDAAFSVAEFLALTTIEGIDIVIDSDDLCAQPDDDLDRTLKLEIARECAQRTPNPANKKIVFRFGVSPVEFLGEGRVQGLRIQRHSGQTEIIDTTLVLRSIGYRSAPIPGVPFDTVTARVPNDHGRILDHDQHGRPVPASYVTGWLKRGPRGVIGTNRGCAEQTVAQLWEDFDAGLLDRDLADRDALPQLLSRRGVEAVDWQGWQAINTAEQKRGAETARPRIKYVHLAEALAAARI